MRRCSTATGITRCRPPHKGRKVVRKAGKQVLLIGAGDRVFAIANRCPHEGYPLSEGTLGPDCVLTCNWHNWKFDLASGAALVGRDPVRTYAIEIAWRARSSSICPIRRQRRSGSVRLTGVEAAIADNDRPRMAREIARLERAGFDASEAVVTHSALRNERLEDGMTHAHAAAADWLALAERAADAGEAAGRAARAAGAYRLGHPGRRRISLCAGIAALGRRTRSSRPSKPRTRRRRRAGARRARGKACRYAQLRPAFARSRARALCGFRPLRDLHVEGRSADRTRLASDVAEPLLLALTRMLVHAPRARNGCRNFAVMPRRGRRGTGAAREPARAEEFIGQSIDGALRRTLACSGRPPRELYDALLGAAAWNLLHFDTAFDRATNNAIADNVGWLDFTHALTFANACRTSVRGAARPVAASAAAAGAVRRTQPEICQRAEQDVGAGVSNDRARLSSARDGDALRPRHCRADHRLPSSEGAVRAGRRACARRRMRRGPTTMCAAVNRYLNTPMKRHHGLRIASQALDFVSREG